jgi:glycosyltransferase involved in cell wall biosynthesis
MKIVVIGTAHPFRGGLASFNERMALELQNEGHEVSIYTFTVQYPSFFFPGKTQYSNEPAPLHLKIQRKINAVNPFNWLKVGREIKRQLPDLVLIKYWLPFMGPCFGTILRCIKKNKKTKIISILDNVIPHESRLGDKQFTRYFVRSVDAFVAMSKSVQEDLMKFNKNKPCALNPHPVFDNFGERIARKNAREHLSLDDHEKYILFFGIIRDYKGLDWLLEAFNRSKYRNKVKLLIAGEYYTDQEKYKERINTLNLQDCIVAYNQFIDDSEVKYWFSAANVLVQPYKNATQSGVTQIAYQFDLPMIVTNVGGLPEMIPHNKIGLVVAPEISSLTEAIDTFFDGQLDERFIANFPEEKQKYTWSTLNKTIFTLLTQLKQ